MSTPILEVSGLRKVFPGRGRAADIVAVDEISFTVQRGGSLAIVGESGSGKTTTVRMVVGLEEPTAGTIAVDGRTLGKADRRRKGRQRLARDIQMVFQDPYSSLDPQQTVESALLEVLALHGVDDKSERQARVAELADQVGLDERQLRSLPRQLSGGQRQRVTIARALAPRPQLIVLDEAVASLDVSIQAQILNLLADIQRDEGIAYLLISHDLAVVRQLCDEVVVMRNGEVVESGDVESVLETPQHPYTQRLRDSVPAQGWDPEAILRAR